MVAEHKFLKVREGISYFAGVALDFVNESERNRSDSQGLITIDVSGAEVSYPGVADWINAACDGIRDSIRHLIEAGKINQPGTVKLLRILGTIVDTTDDAVGCAAGLATHKLFDPNGPEPRVSPERPWKLMYE